MIIRKKHIPQFLNEVDVAGTPAGDETTEDPDYTATDDPAPGDPPADDSTPKGAEPPEGDAVGGEGMDSGGEEDIDYTQGGDPGIGDEGNPEGEDTGTASAEGDNQVTADDARGMEQELFQDLTPDQIDLKHKELKNKFLDLYNATSNIVDRVNEIPTSDNTVASITFVTKKLAEFRKMVADYMNDVYSTKSYMENSINYNRFLAALSGINKILDEINKELVNNDDNEADR